MSNIETKALQWIIAGLDSPLIGQGSDIIKGLLAEINRLKGEMEDKDKVIKLLQGHCNALMDTEGKLAQWKKGHTAGQESAGFEVQRYDEVIRQLRKELSDENANFTAFTKRFFALPQAYLGVAFGFGIPMAFAALQGHVPPIGWLMLAANILWTLAYDTEYAMVDRDDDVRLGIRTAAILFGRFDVAAVMAFHAGFIALMAWVGFTADLGAAYFAGLVVAAILCGWQFRMIRARDRQGCFRAFLHNNWVGATVFAGLLVDSIAI